MVNASGRYVRGRILSNSSSCAVFGFVALVACNDRCRTRPCALCRKGCIGVTELLPSHLLLPQVFTSAPPCSAAGETCAPQAATLPQA